MSYESWGPCPKCGATVQDGNNIESTADDWGCRKCGARWDSEGKVISGDTTDSEPDSRIGQETSRTVESNPDSYSTGIVGSPVSHGVPGSTLD